MLSFAFAVIAAVNLTAVVDISNVRLACRDLLLSGTLTNSPAAAIQIQIAKGVQPPPLSAVLGVQIGGDLLTLATLWYLALARRGGATPASGSY